MPKGAGWKTPMVPRVPVISVDTQNNGPPQGMVAQVPLTAVKT